MKPHLILFGLILFVPVADYAIGQTPALEHSKKMHAMENEMRQMEKDMDAHRSMQHCMPVMKAHCREIADLEYMEKRMKLMRTYMQYCSVDENDCRMPEMTGEMKAMREKMDDLSVEMMPPGGLQNSIREKPRAPEK
ncbi:MAG: hypothetical protein Q7N95_11005 [Alphaproteobacteria bacterium]|nr:hypothetical protein [Alphaproteobacteria bacterium]